MIIVYMWSKLMTISQCLRTYFKVFKGNGIRIMSCMYYVQNCMLISLLTPILL